MENTATLGTPQAQLIQEPAQRSKVDLQAFRQIHCEFGVDFEPGRHEKKKKGGRRVGSFEALLDRYTVSKKSTTRVRLRRQD